MVYFMTSFCGQIKWKRLYKSSYPLGAGVPVNTTREVQFFANVTDEGDDDIKAIMNDYVKRTARKEI